VSSINFIILEGDKKVSFEVSSNTEGSGNVKPVLSQVNDHKFQVSSGEEWLLNPASFQGSSGKSVRIFAGCDAGSTQTRVCLVDKTDYDNVDDNTTLSELLGEPYVIPSYSKLVPDMRKIISKGQELWANLDSIVKSSQLDSEVRLVRGQRVLDVDLATNRLSSAIGKVDTDSLYYNIYDALGYAVFSKYKSVPTNVELWLSCSLPPEDFNDLSISRFKDRLRDFVWSSQVYKCTISFRIMQVFVYTEPESNVKAYHVLNDKDIPQEVLHVEGGGRNVSSDILNGGISLSVGSESFTNAGANLLKIFGDKYREMRQRKPPSDDNIERALITGKIKVGAESEDVINVLIESKNALADQIYDNLIAKVFGTQQSITLDTLDLITFGGRLFDAGDYSYSVADRLAYRFKEVAPKTVTRRFTKNYIPWGLVLLMLSSLSEE
jgi:hypothetical protein